MRCAQLYEYDQPCPAHLPMQLGHCASPGCCGTALAHGATSQADPAGAPPPSPPGPPPRAPGCPYDADRCVEQGVRKVVVAPYFLSNGRHIQDDIPGLVKEAQAKHPGIECSIAGPIGAWCAACLWLCGRAWSACMLICFQELAPRCC